MIILNRLGQISAGNVPVLACHTALIARKLLLWVSSKHWTGRLLELARSPSLLRKLRRLSEYYP
eukprot:bmy_06081T0